MILPESLIPAFRFKRDSDKSPSVPITDTIKLRTIQCVFQTSGNHIATKSDDAIVKTAAPIVPSHVLPGDTLSNNFLFPTKLPTR